MTEQDIVVDKLSLAYEGLFNLKDFYKLFEDFAKDRGYDFIELKHTESVTTEGKYVVFGWRFQKKLTDYAKSIINANIIFSELNERIVQKDKKREKLHTGKIQMSFDGILETDYEKRWIVKPAFYLMRALFEKYVYSPYILQFKKEIKETSHSLKEEVESYLNLLKR